MFKHVMVGVNGADGGRDALALARILRNEDSALTLAYVYPHGPVLWPGPTAAYEAAESEGARDVLEQARKDAEVDAQLRWCGAPSVGRGLSELAEAIGADLLVIGSSRRGLLGRVLIGDDIRAALNGAPCAVAIAPAGYAKHPVVMREIGVGYDASPESEHALGAARELATGHGSRLSAFEAVAFPSYMFIGPAVPGEGTIEELVDAARERVASVDGVEPHAAYGQPAEELALYSASLDLLMIGSRSYGPIGRLVHGSTAQQLAGSARCPLLVLTRAAREADAAQAALRGREVAGAGGAA